MYIREPIKRENNIDVFVSDNKYITNYDIISKDHLSALEKSGANPFMDEEDWTLIENSTIKLVKNYSKGGIILDVGVGTGRLLSLLNETYQKNGVDISLDYLALAKSKGIDVCKAMIEELPYKNGFFDLITCTDVLEHVLDLNKSISEMFRVLKVGGYMIIRVPYRENLKAYLSPSVPYEFVHLRNFDEFCLKLLFEKVFEGKVIDYNTIGPYLNRNIIKDNLLNPIKLFPALFSYIFRFINRKMYYFFGKYFLPKSEINIVVQKKAI
jgi:ubiquinone/menaquinone biosynthesis C-methylase UbiE